MRNICIFLGAALLLASCDDDADSKMIIDAEYLPTDQPGQFYQREIFTSDDFSERLFNDTVHIHFAGEMELRSRLYNKFELHLKSNENAQGYDPFFPNRENQYFNEGYRHFRKEGSKYFEPAYNGERVFLDLEKPVGSSWEYVYGTDLEWQRKIIYTIKDADLVTTVNGVTYEGVIEVTKQTLTKWPEDTSFTVYSLETTFYARGIGEILTVSSYMGYYNRAHRLSLLRK